MFSLITNQSQRLDIFNPVTPSYTVWQGCLPLQRERMIRYRNPVPDFIFPIIPLSQSLRMASPEPPASRQKIDERVDKLETLFTHLEKTVQDLDDVVIDGHQRIENLSHQVQDLQRRVTQSPEAAADAKND